LKKERGGKVTLTNSGPAQEGKASAREGGPREGEKEGEVEMQRI